MHEVLLIFASGLMTAILRLLALCCCFVVIGAVEASPVELGAWSLHCPQLVTLRDSEVRHKTPLFSVSCMFVDHVT
jgi:hypothetical protein